MLAEGFNYLADLFTLPSGASTQLCLQSPLLVSYDFDAPEELPVPPLRVITPKAFAEPKPDTLLANLTRAVVDPVDARPSVPVQDADVGVTKESEPVVGIDVVGMAGDLHEKRPARSPAQCADDKDISQAGATQGMRRSHPPGWFLPPQKPPPGGWKFKCGRDPSCRGLVFDRKSKLEKHMLKHTGEKPFICTWCGSRFVSTSNLKRHQGICKLKKVTNNGYDEGGSDTTSPGV